ncbi:GNAT family N-acetyltransferase [Yinghuangia soli]|uniref:GNAT family N-acetyltransferase n=1 Tax=Yinghuangia soli TaxID=2908204 RepID=A0AA41Q695_9ACTN|nr:GNAT family N-acetyltransferase [Yinghuangia soli]MCF2532353.1 GNAT family N-acetyltransferase [Yinghuangia soli]
MDDCKIRTAGLDDVAAVLAFWTAAAEGTSITDDPDGVALLITRDPGALLIAEAPDGGIAGTLIAGFDGWRCSLYRLAVDPALRRRGIARLLLAAAEDRFAELGGRRLDAMVLDRNEAGRATWAAAGYTPDDSWTRWTRTLRPAAPAEARHAR